MGALAFSVLALPACSVRVGVAVRARAGGSGVVTVTVTLDKAAAAAVGDIGSQLQTADLAAAGWQVSGPRTEPGGLVVLAVSHPFSSFAQLPPIVAQVAGSAGASGTGRGTPAGAAVQPFRFFLQRRNGFWTTTTRFYGTADLTCGLACFGDPGLTRLLGSPTGVDPAAAGRLAGVNPESVFHFFVTVSLPGGVQNTNAASRSRGTATWAPPLGGRLNLVATSQAINATPLVVGGVGAAMVLAVMAAGTVHLVRRRRRSRLGRGAVTARS